MSEVKPGTLEAYLREVRMDLKMLENVFEKLECKKLNVDLLSILYEKSTKKDIEKYIEKYKINFLSKYIIVVVEDFAASPVDYDLILASYGLLRGYNLFQQVNERHAKYCKDIGKIECGKPIPLNEYWSSKTIDKNLNSKENSAIKRLALGLESQTRSNNGRLEYIKKTQDSVEQLFPIPKYLQENGYRKYYSNGKEIYIPLSKRELRNKLNNSPINRLNYSYTSNTEKTRDLNKNQEPKLDILKDIFKDSIYIIFYFCKNILVKLSIDNLHSIRKFLLDIKIKLKIDNEEEYHKLMKEITKIIIGSMISVTVMSFVIPSSSKFDEDSTQLAFDGEYGYDDGLSVTKHNISITTNTEDDGNIIDNIDEPTLKTSKIH